LSVHEPPALKTATGGGVAAAPSAVDDLLNDLLGEGEGPGDSVPPAAQVSSAHMPGGAEVQGHVAAEPQNTEGRHEQSKEPAEVAGDAGREPDLFAGLGIVDVQEE
jgi:hypothetical protein